MLSIRKQVNVISTLKIQQVKTYECLKHANERIRYYTKPKKSRKRLTGRTLGPPPASNQNHIPYCGLRAEKVISSFHGPAILNHGGWMTLKGLRPLHQNALCSWIRGERLALAESSTKTVTLWQRVTVTLALRLPPSSVPSPGSRCGYRATVALRPPLTGAIWWLPLEEDDSPFRAGPGV